MVGTRSRNLEEESQQLVGIKGVGNVQVRHGRHQVNQKFVRKDYSSPLLSCEVVDILVESLGVGLVHCSEFTC